MVSQIGRLRFLLFLFLLSSNLIADGRPGNFTVLGPGGGGAMFHPTISPHDVNTALVACDMTGAYITRDGGHHWRMFNLRDVVQFFAFDPTNANTIYAGTKALWRSTDAGESWKLVYPKPSSIQGIRMSPDHADETIVANPDPLRTIRAIAIDPNDDRVLYVAAGSGQKFALFMSSDAGDSWRELKALPEQPQRMWIDPDSAR